MKPLIFLFALTLPVMLTQAKEPSGEHLAYTVGCVNCLGRGMEEEKKIPIYFKPHKAKEQHQP